MSHFITARAAGSRFGLLLLTAGFGCVMAAGVAAAATTDQVAPSVVIKYSTEALATDAGVQDLYRRIVRAAKKVCPEAGIKELAANASAHECQEQAIARAVRNVNNSRLALLYAAASKRG
jgi:UrcA family protein